MITEFHRLRGNIRLVKEIRLHPNKPYYEKHYEDEAGNKTIVVRHDHWREKEIGK